MKLSEEKKKEIYHEPLEISKFMNELYKKYPSLKFRYSEDKKWYLLTVFKGNFSQNYIVTFRSLRNKENGYKRLKVIMRDIERGFRL